MSVNLLALDSEKHKLRYRTANTATATKRNGPKRQLQLAAWLPQIWPETATETVKGVDSRRSASSSCSIRCQACCQSIYGCASLSLSQSLSLFGTLSNCVCELHIKLLSNIKLTAALAVAQSLQHWGTHTPNLSSASSTQGLFVCCTKNETRNATRRRTSRWHCPELRWRFPCSFHLPSFLSISLCLLLLLYCVCNTRNFNAILNASISFCES